MRYPSRSVTRHGVALALAGLGLLSHTGDAAAQQETFVVVTLDTNVNGLNIDPGTPVAWSVSIQVLSAGRDLGLMGFVTDLVISDYPGQTPAENRLTPSGVPAGMERFSRPLGISNPPPPGSGLDTGYGGTPGVVTLNTYGTPYPAYALLEIGGMQNPFGVSGETMGTEASCEPRLAQSAPRIVASGEFPAYNYPGYYAVELQHLVVNIFSYVAAPPEESSVQQMSSEYWWSPDTHLAPPPPFGFYVVCRADFNNNGEVSVEDLFAFLNAYFALDPSADFDLNGEVTVNDLFVFLDLYFIGCS